VASAGGRSFLGDAARKFSFADGQRVNLFSFDKDREVRTKQLTFKDSSIDELLESGEFTKVNSDQEIPTDTPFYEVLSDDERFATVEALIANQDQLTEIDGIGPSRKEDIINHVSKSKN
jgi:hypothetical protein